MKGDEFYRTYKTHKSQAYYYNKGTQQGMFQLTFEEWKDLWVSSGQWNNRGRNSKQYCMSRKDSSKPLTKDNAIIITNHERMILMHSGKVLSDETKAKMSKASKGKPKSEDHKQAMSLASRKAHARKGHTLSKPLNED